MNQLIEICDREVIVYEAVWFPQCLEAGASRTGFPSWSLGTSTKPCESLRPFVQTHPTFAVFMTGSADKFRGTLEPFVD